MTNKAAFLCSWFQVKDVDNERLSAFFRRNSYLAGRYTEAESFSQLQSHLNSLCHGTGANYIFYLALPPTVYHSVTTNIRQQCMSDK